MRYFFFNYTTNQLDDMGEFTSWRAAYDTVVDVYSGLVWSEEQLRNFASDRRHHGGIKLQNVRTQQTFRIIENEDGSLSLERDPFPIPPQPRRYVGD